MSNLKHLDVCTHIRNAEDRDILTRKGFDVNLRLMRTSPQYREIVLSACRYILELATTTREGYSQPYGYSGANAGIPWNIIANRNGTLMINPHILAASGRFRVHSTDCGSLTLEKPIYVNRCREVTIEYWDMALTHFIVTGHYPTEQHEIDHNLGILIWDRTLEKEHDCYGVKV